MYLFHIFAVFCRPLFLSICFFISIVALYLFHICFFRRLLFLSICSTICNIKLCVPRNIIIRKQTSWWIKSRLQKITSNADWPGYPKCGTKWSLGVLSYRWFSLKTSSYPFVYCWKVYHLFIFFFHFTVSFEVYLFPKAKTKNKNGDNLWEASAIQKSFTRRRKCQTCKLGLCFVTKLMSH